RGEVGVLDLVLGDQLLSGGGVDPFIPVVALGHEHHHEDRDEQQCPEQGGTEELLGVHTGTGSPDFLTRRCGGPPWRPADRVETTRTPAHFGYQGNVHPCHGVPGRWTGRRDPPSSA